jgi:hypothetical protein
MRAIEYLGHFDAMPTRTQKAKATRTKLNGYLKPVCVTATRLEAVEQDTVEQEVVDCLPVCFLVDSLKILFGVPRFNKFRKKIRHASAIC